MDPTRIHLFITHLPLFGLFLGILALIYALVVRSKQVNILALLIILIATIGAIIAMQTGEAAEETAETITGIVESAVEEHEESAELTALFFYGLGILSCIALYLEVKKKDLAKLFLWIVLIFGAITFYLVLDTATLGGKIRHTEIAFGESTPDSVFNS